MNQPARILVLATILMLAHLPLPWRHSHSGMSSPQLAAHLVCYHAATSAAELPRGWHWHVFQYGQDGKTHLVPPSADSVADAVDSSIRLRGPLAAAISSDVANSTACYVEAAPLTSALAVESQRAYLRYHVLLN